MRKLLFVIAGLSILVFGALVALPKLAFRKPMSQTYVKDRGYFYRFKANFEVKATSEKVAFDYVAACNVRLTRWRDGGLSDDTTLSPRAMVQATRDGHAVMLQTVNGCHGLTSENGDVPPDLLPLAVWFEDISDLSAGLGYASEDAYENPVAKLAFHGARIDHATREEWEEWRRKSSEHYVQQGVLPGPWGSTSPTPIRRILANTYEFATAIDDLNCLMMFVPNCSSFGLRAILAIGLCQARLSDLA